MPFTSRKLRGRGVCVYIVHTYMLKRCNHCIVTRPEDLLLHPAAHPVLIPRLCHAPALRESLPHSRLIWNINQWNSIHATDCLLFCSTTPPGGPQSPVPFGPHSPTNSEANSMHANNSFFLCPRCGSLRVRGAGRRLRCKKPALRSPTKTGNCQWTTLV